MEKQGDEEANAGLKMNTDKYGVFSKGLEQTDLISSLPDCLRLHILSFLKMKDMANSNLLSKSWRYLWMSTSCLDFQIENWDNAASKFTFIDRALFHYDGPKLQKLRIFYYYRNADDLKIDSWIYMAIRKNVEELVLDLYNGKVVPQDDWADTRYKLPHSLYKCRTLTSLTLSFCDLNMPASIQLSSIQKLSLELLDLSSQDITFITSNCPLLEDFTLNGCNMYSDLNIVITNQNLKSLTIYEYRKTAAHTKVIICAPYVVSLTFKDFLGRENYCTKKMKSLKDVSFCEIFKDAEPDKLYDEHHISVGLLRDLYYVEKLVVCMSLVQLLAIRGLQDIHPLYFSTTCLDVETQFTKWELPGISYLLKSFPKLKTLNVKVPQSVKEMNLSDVFKDEFAFEERSYWKYEEYDFCSTLQNLESVNIYNFLKGTQEESTVEEDLVILDNKIAFAQFLLKNSKALKEMTIKCGEVIQSNYGLFSRLTEELVAFPRASSSAAVIILKNMNAEMENERKANTWTPPKSGFMKINFGACFYGDSKTCATGATCIDDRGVLLSAAYRKIKSQRVEDAEYQAALTAVDLAHELNISHVIFEGDCQAVINSLLMQDSNKILGSSYVVHDILSSCNSFQEFSFCWCDRVGNSYAHEVARWAINAYDHVPNFLLSAIRPVFLI